MVSVTRFTVLVSCCASASVLTSGGMKVDVNVSAGTYTVRIDGALWLPGGLSAVPVRGGSQHLRQIAPPSAVQQGADLWGTFERVEWYWGTAVGGPTLLATSIRAYMNGTAARELLAFEQHWPQGHTGGASTGSSNSAIAPFPTFFTSAAAAANATATAAQHGRKEEEEVLNFWQWGGCQLANSWGGRWTNATSVPGGDHFGIPTVLFSAVGRAVTLGPSGNWLVAVLDSGAAPSCAGAGVAASVRSLPRGFKYETLLVGGTGITASVRAYGDTLLRKSGKARVARPHARDFVLGHLGYWTEWVVERAAACFHGCSY